MSLVKLLAQFHIQIETSSPLFFLYSHYIHQIMDRQYHQLSDLLGQRQQYITTIKQAGAYAPAFLGSLTLVK